MGGLASRRLCRTSWGLLPPLRDTKCLAFVLWLAMNGCCVLDVHLNVVFQSILAKRGAPVVRSAFRKHSRSNALACANLFREPCRNTSGSNPAANHTTHTPSTVPAEWRAPPDTIEAHALAHWSLVNTNFVRPLFPTARNARFSGVIV